MLLYLDLETVPTTDQDVIETLSAKIAAPANYKKPESIAEWERENKPQAVKEAVAKTSFDGAYGRIVCICYAFDDGKVFSVHGDDEKTLLEQFYSHVYDLSTGVFQGYTSDVPLTVIGHNVAGFDLPFLKHRSIINRVTPPAAILKAMNARPWDNCIADTMLMWSSDREKRASMDKLCRAFGIEGKGDFDGSMVADTWPVDPQKVVDYCCADVERTRALYYRMTFQWGKADAVVGTVSAQQDVASTPPIRFTHKPQVDAAMITEFMALLPIVATEKKALREHIVKWEKYRLARELAAAA